MTEQQREAIRATRKANADAAMRARNAVSGARERRMDQAERTAEYRRLGIPEEAIAEHETADTDRAAELRRKYPFRDAEARISIQRGERFTRALLADE